MKLSSRSTVVSSLVVVAVLGVSACTATGTSDNPPPPAGASSTEAPSASSTPSATTPTIDPVVWTTNPTGEATDVAVDTRVTARAEKGELTKASLSYVSKKGNKVEVAGTLGGGTWTAGDLLEPGVRYTLDLVAKDSAGVETEDKRTFRSANLRLDDQIYVQISPGDGASVGIGMPVIVRFDLPVTDKAAFEKKMTVTSAPAQEGSWYWVSSTEAHWRPKTYWKPGTAVRVDADLNSHERGY